MKIAYLVNVYPAVSHSFIRREILALEALGHSVYRFSIRPSARTLPDALDQREQARTTVVLGGRRLGLVLAGVRWALSHPVRFGRAFVRAGQMVDGGRNRTVRRLAYLLEGCWLATRLRAIGADHLHVHFGTNPAAVARIIHILSTIPYSITVHGPDEFDAPLAIDLPGKIADACFVAGVSEFGRSQLSRWAPLDQWRKLVVVRCGLEIERSGSTSHDAARDIDICTVARLAPQKGLPILLSAIAQLHERGLRISASLVGDGPLRPELERQAAALGIAQQISFLGDCDGATVMAMLSRSKIMVLPSFAEGLPVVIMEAFACRTPVVTTFIAGIPELVDESCGWLVPAGSTDHLADAIADALSLTQAERDARADQGRNRVRDRHDVHASARAIARLIEAGGA